MFIQRVLLELAKATCVCVEHERDWSEVHHHRHTIASKSKSTIESKKATDGDSNGPMDQEQS
jgi:hypothetical protein